MFCTATLRKAYPLLSMACGPLIKTSMSLPVILNLLLYWPLKPIQAICVVWRKVVSSHAYPKAAAKTHMHKALPHVCWVIIAAHTQQQTNSRSKRNDIMTQLTTTKLRPPWVPVMMTELTFHSLATEEGCTYHGTHRHEHPSPSLASPPHHEAKKCR